MTNRTRVHARCDERCQRIAGLVEAHERIRGRMRTARKAKLHGRRPRMRATGAV